MINIEKQTIYDIVDAIRDQLDDLESEVKYADEVEETDELQTMRFTFEGWKKNVLATIPSTCSLKFAMDMRDYFENLKQY